MLKFFIGLVLSLGSTAFASNENIACHGLGSDDSAYSYCVTKAFYFLGQDFDVKMHTCYGLGRRDREFEKCVNRNFNAISEQAKNLVFMSCVLDRSQPLSFEGCVNDNFKQIEEDH